MNCGKLRRVPSIPALVACLAITDIKNKLQEAIHFL
jgi:ribosome biogenesis protein Tsr3